MKELSIEEKAKRYDKVVAMAKECITHIPDEAVNEYMLNMFPELKETEKEKDARISKSIIQCLKGTMPDSPYRREYISWLENQSKERSWKPSKEEMDVLYGLAYITNQYDEHKEDVITRLYQDLKREFFNGSSYENMFPTNTSTEDDVRRRSIIQVLEYARSLDTYNQYGKADIDKNIAWLEKQSEQKPVDKVEPKFKTGQWIVWQDKCYKVNYNGCGYELVDKNGLSTSLEYGTVNENAHLWDITKDAKEGDILVIESGRPFIFKGCLDERHPNSPVAYCGIDCGDDFHVSISNSWWTNKKCFPATKEQRDTLEKAMLKAGYKWNTEERKLEKI